MGELTSRPNYLLKTISTLQQIFILISSQINIIRQAKAYLTENKNTIPLVFGQIIGDVIAEIIIITSRRSFRVNSSNSFYILSYSFPSKAQNTMFLNTSLYSEYNLPVNLY